MQFVGCAGALSHQHVTSVAERRRQSLVVEKSLPGGTCDTGFLVRRKVASREEQRGYLLPKTVMVEDIKSFLQERFCTSPEKSRNRCDVTIDQVPTVGRRQADKAPRNPSKKREEDANVKTNIKEHMYAKNKRTGKAIGVFQRHFIHIDRNITCAFRVIRTK